MKNFHQNKKLKQLSDQHEVPFNPEAWDKMETLLDNNSDTPPPKVSPRGSTFFNYKNIIAMLILLMILMFSIFPMDDDPARESIVTNSSTTVQELEYNNDLATTKTFTKEEIETTTTATIATTTTDNSNFKNKNNNTSTDLWSGSWIQPTLATPTSQYNYVTKSVPADNSFIENLNEQLATYHQFRAEEKVYLHFDRTMLKPGESLWFSAYVRDANTLQPSAKSDMIYVEFIAPNGTVLKKLKLIAVDGIAKGDIQTTEELAGGIYKIKAYTNWQKNFNTTFERNITLQKTVLPHLRMQLDFEREAYGAGDEVIAKLDLNTLENTPLANFDFNYQVSVAGANISQQQSKTDEKGHVEFKFNLPKDLNSNDGLVNVMLQYNGQGESISRSIPIVLNKMDVQFFPEGGDLVADLDQRIAFKALNEFGKPADVEGTIINSNGVIVSNFKSYHQGMGAFNFHPLKDEKYTAKITQPKNIKGEFELPKALPNGNTLEVVNVDNEEMQVKVQTAENESLTLVLQAQGKLIHTVSTSAKAGAHLLKIPTQDAPMGVAQLTLFDRQERPHAERLVFLNKHKTLDIKITTNKNQYLPREKVRMNIEVKDENGKPVEGQFSVAVTDDKLLSYADDKQGRILAYMLLESDLKGEIEEPNFYFEPAEKHPKKDQAIALDYLMMTNGWRRFKWKNQSEPIAGMIYQNEKASVGGIVYDAAGMPVKDAIVKIEGTDKTVITDAEGRFTFNQVSFVNQKTKRNVTLTLVASKGVMKSRIARNYGMNYNMQLPFDSNKAIATTSIASNGQRQVRGQVKDVTGEPLIGANIIITGAGTGTTTDIDGKYVLNMPEGEQILSFSYTGFSTFETPLTVNANESVIANVQLNEGMSLDEVVVSGYGTQRRFKKSRSKKKEKVQQQKASIEIKREVNPQVQTTAVIIDVETGKYIDLATSDPYTENNSSGKIKNGNVVNGSVSTGIIKTGIDNVTTDEVVITAYKVPLIQQDETSQGKTVTSEQIKNLPTRNINAVAAATAGVSSSDEGGPITIKGSRSNATDYYIDGVRVSGDLLPESEIAQLQVITGGTPAQFEGNDVFRNGNEDIDIEDVEVDLRQNIAKESKSKKRTWRVNSYVANEPVVVIDGKQLIQLSMVKIKPEDIKAVDILEGDAQKAIYGERAENGVILIDTKKKKKDNSNTAIIDYQNQLVEKANTQVKEYQTLRNWSKQMIGEGKVKITQIQNVQNMLHAQNQKVSSTKKVAGELSRLTGVYPKMDYAEVDDQFIQDYKYAYNFKQGLYHAREFYTPKYTAASKKGARDDFRPTIHWAPIVSTDANGKALLEFYNSDELTTFRASVEGITSAGQVGSGTHTYFTQMPFGLRTKLPTQVLDGDELTIPVTIANNTDEFMEIKLEAIVPQGFEYIGQDLSLYQVDAQSVETLYLPFQVKAAAGEHHLEVKVSANGHVDSFAKKVKVLSRGFPVNVMLSGNDLEDNLSVDISNMIAGSSSATFTVYPSLLNDLSAGMDRMIRQPSGCFEQTSSKNYPNLLVLDYLKSTNTLDQNLGKRLYDVLDKGYNRLLTFEIQGGGFDWFSRPPAHEGLSAYGLMQFKDMQRVHHVDQDVLDRTANWLLTRKDGKGGWLNSKRGAHSWGAHNPASDAYITWAMTEAGYGSQVKKEIEKSYQDAKESKDAYVLALAVNMLHNVKDQRANDLLKILLKQQSKDGSWNAKTTMTRSGGVSLLIETTALTALAIMKVGDGLSNLDKAMNFIASKKSTYGFGSTQSTVLAMKALIEHAQFSSTMSSDGTVTLMIDGEKIGTQKFTSEQKDPIVFDKIEKYFTEGKHDVKVLFGETEKALPYDLEINYNTTLPKNDAECKVDLNTTLQNNTGKVGENIRLSVELKNTTDELIPSPIAKIGIPSGLNLQPWQLKELQDKNTFDYYEIMDGYLVVYYRKIGPNETKTVHLDLKADLAGSYEAPASVAYLYYTNELQNWSKPELVKVTK